MKNFIRALKFAWPYRYRIVFSVTCAILAAAFWSLNFTAIYPILKILGSDQNLQSWVDQSIKDTQEKSIEPLERHTEFLKSQEKKLDQMEPMPHVVREKSRITRELAKVTTRLESSRNELYRYTIAKKYIDWLCPEGRFQTMVLLICLVVLAVAIKGLFEFAQETQVGIVVNRSLFDLRTLFYRRAIRLDIKHFNEQGTHELMARFTNDTEMLGNGLKMLFGKVVAQPLRALGCIVVACWISWQLTFLFLVLVPIVLFVLAKISALMKRATRRLLDRMSIMYKILQETFQGIRVVKAFTRESAERRRFRAATKDYYHRAVWVVTLDAMAGPIIEMLGAAAVAAAVLAGAYLVLEGKTHLFGMRMSDHPLESESLLQLYVLMAAISDPVRKLSSVFTKIQSGAAAADRIFQSMDQEPEVGANSEGQRLQRHKRDIEFRGVCFSYDPGHPILTNIDLHVRHGETIAFVGKNGCGKSTLLNLIPRYFDPDHGSVLIDGHDVRSANLRSLRHQIGVVTQDTILFDDTIANNIRYGERRATQEQIEEAAKQAHAHDLISALPNGYETRVGEAGAKLSGGQKQRIALARAILRDPAILILDEFTSQADAENEAVVHHVLREFIRNRTTFVITHRFNTLEIADRIVVLDEGGIIAIGTHQDLLRSCGLYQRLHEAHFQRMVA